MGGMPPPPMTAPPRGGSGQGQQLNPQMAPVGAGGGGPASTGRGAQFYSVGLQGGAAPTPTPLQVSSVYEAMDGWSRGGRQENLSAMLRFFPRKNAVCQHVSQVLVIRSRVRSLYFL